MRATSWNSRSKSARGHCGSNEQLPAEIGERLRAEETLQKTQAELAHVSRVMTVGELAVSIAHEVNQPLMAVVINGDAGLEWLNRDPPNLAEAREAVGRIISEGNRAGEIIRRIRALIRKSSPQKAPIQMNDLPLACSVDIPATVYSCPVYSVPRAPT